MFYIDRKVKYYYRNLTNLRSATIYNLNDLSCLPKNTKGNEKNQLFIIPKIKGISKS